MIKNLKKRSYRLSAFVVILLLVFGCIMLTNANAKSTDDPPQKQTENSEYKGHLGQIIFDKIDYPFQNDEQLIGKWESVDFIDQIGNFNPEHKNWQGDLYLKSITVLENGQMAQPVTDGITTDEKTPVSWFTWTKGYIIHHGDITASKYTIEEINGTQYLFMEWKSGDYSLRGKQPCYYVFKKTN